MSKRIFNVGAAVFALSLLSLTSGISAEPLPALSSQKAVASSIKPVKGLKPLDLKALEKSSARQRLVDCVAGGKSPDCDGDGFQSERFGGFDCDDARSEERRVGNGGRCRWGGYHWKREGREQGEE